jgi:hypothetical protein
MGLTVEQHAKAVEMCDQFQVDLHQALVAMPAQRQTYSRLADVDMGLETDSEDFE